MPGHKDAIAAGTALNALAQETRLGMFRCLVAAGTAGLAAGGIARGMGVPHNTMSAHIAVLVRAGLVTSRRDGRSVIYAADLPGLRALLGFLLEDCCGGRAEMCAPLLDTVLAAAKAASCCAKEPA
jgi:DNA-binding transcriptional ArsR family regulator